MKKIVLIELLQQRTGRIVSPGMLNTALGRAFNQLLFETFRSKLGSYDSYATRFERRDVKYDESGMFYYTSLPANIIQLPFKTDGVRNITSPQDSNLNFAPVSEIQEEIITGLEVGYIADSNIPIGFMLSKTASGEIIRYQKGRISNVKKVNLLLLVPIEDMEMTDEIKIPSGKDVELIGIALQILSGMPPDDKVNDGNAKTI